MRPLGFTALLCVATCALPVGRPRQVATERIEARKQFQKGDRETKAVADHEDADKEAPDESFRTDCLFFEAIEFGTITVARFQGTTWFGERDIVLLPDVQIAARSVVTGKDRFQVTGSDGKYRFIDLPPGEYDVWTCLDGFDELRFRLVLDPNAEGSGVDLYVPLSEGSGRFDVVITGAAGDD